MVAAFLSPTQVLGVSPVKVLSLPLNPIDFHSFLSFMIETGKETIHRPAPVQNFSLQKKMGPQRKDFGGGYGFPGFYRVFVSTTGLESSSLRRKVLQKFFFRWWLCTLFSSL